MSAEHPASFSVPSPQVVVDDGDDDRSIGSLERRLSSAVLLGARDCDEEETTDDDGRDDERSDDGGSASDDHDDDPYAAEDYDDRLLTRRSTTCSGRRDSTCSGRRDSATGSKRTGRRRRSTLSVGSPAGESEKPSKPKPKPSSSRYPEPLDGLSARLRGLRSALLRASSPCPPSVVDEGGGGGGDAAAGGAGLPVGGSMDMLSTNAVSRGSLPVVGGSMDMLLTNLGCGGGGGVLQRRGQAAGSRRSRHRRSFMDSFMMGSGHLDEANAGASVTGRFVESASFLVSALCGLADACPKVASEHELAGLWEHTSNVDTALSGIGPVLNLAADPDGCCDDDVIPLDKVSRMAKLMDSMSETVRRVTDEETTSSSWNAETECRFGTLAELLCLTCIQTIKSACSADADSRSVSSGCSREMDEQISWRISDALSRTWEAAPGQRNKLAVLRSDIGDLGLCEVDSDLFVELSLLVLRSLEWPPNEAVCEELELELDGRSFLAGVKREGYCDLYGARTLLCLGNVHASMGQYDQALSHYEESLHIRKLNLGENHYQVADVHKSLGNMYYLLGYNELADAQYTKAVNSLELCEVDCPASDETLISVLLLRSNLKARLGQVDEALDTLGVCLEIQKASLGKTHPDVADALRKRAALRLDAQRDEEALDDLWSALRIYKAVYGDEHEFVGDTLHDMGMNLWDRGDGDGAMELLSEALWIRERQSGTQAVDSTKTSSSLARAETQAAIASIHRSAGRTGHAIRMYESCLEIWQSELGENDPRVADAHVALGHSEMDLGNFAEARDHYLEGLSILENNQARSREGMAAGAKASSPEGDDEDDDKIAQLVFFLANLELRDDGGSGGSSSTGGARAARAYLEKFVRLKRSAGRGRDSECAHALKLLAALDRADAKTKKQDGDIEKGGSPEKHASSKDGTGWMKKITLIPKGVEKFRSPFRDSIRRGAGFSSSAPSKKSAKSADDKQTTTRISSLRTISTAASTATINTFNTLTRSGSVTSTLGAQLSRS